MTWKKSVINKKSNKIEQTTKKNLSKRDIPSLVSLQDTVLAYGDISEIFYPESKETFLDDVTTHGYGVGCYVEKKLIAYAILRIPGDQTDNLGIDIDLPLEELQYVAHFETAVVHPDYRGNKLQISLLTELETIAIKNNIHHILCTISPKNIYSLRNAKELGIQIIITKYKYDGKLRHILYKRV